MWGGCGVGNGGGCHMVTIILFIAFLLDTVVYLSFSEALNGLMPRWEPSGFMRDLRPPFHMPLHEAEHVCHLVVVGLHVANYNDPHRSNTLWVHLHVQGLQVVKARLGFLNRCLC